MVQQARVLVARAPRRAQLGQGIAGSVGSAGSVEGPGGRLMGPEILPHLCEIAQGQLDAAFEVPALGEPQQGQLAQVAEVQDLDVEPRAGVDSRTR